MKKDKLAGIILISVLSFIFLVLSFFAFIVIKADYLDFRAGRLDVLRAFKDAIMLGWWSALFFLIKHIYKQS